MNNFICYSRQIYHIFNYISQVAQLEEEKRHLDFMASMRQYDPDPSTEDENAKDRPKDDPVVDLFPDDDADDRNSKCKQISLSLKYHKI